MIFVFRVRTNSHPLDQSMRSLQAIDVPVRECDAPHPYLTLPPPPSTRTVAALGLGPMRPSYTAPLLRTHHHHQHHSVMHQGALLCQGRLVT